MYSPIDLEHGRREDLTMTQTRTLLDALERGYYQVPRQTTLVELADMYGVSDQAVSERLRRATAKLIESSLLTSYSDLPRLGDEPE